MYNNIVLCSIVLCSIILCSIIMYNNIICKIHIYRSIYKIAYADISRTSSISLYAF